MNGLVLHQGANLRTMDEVRQVITPEPTKSWMPIAHSDLIDRVRDTLTGNGLTITTEAHGMTKNGLRYFGLMEVRNGEQASDWTMVVGIRNSHDKSFPGAIALGNRVFVCDNLSFSGEIKLSRKHTTYIKRDLPALVQRAVGRLADLRGLQTKRIEAYKATDLTDDAKVHDLVVRAVYARALPGSQVIDVIDQWREPKHDEFKPRTVWSLANAFTEVYKGHGLALLASRSERLNGLLDSHVGLLGPRTLVENKDDAIDAEFEVVDNTMAV